MLTPFLLSEGVWIALVVVIPVVVGLAAAGLTLFLTSHKSKVAGKNAETVLKEAKIKAEHLIKNAEIDAKQAAFEAKQKADGEISARKGELASLEQKLSLREQAIDQRDSALIQKENNLEKKNEMLDRSIESYKARQAELDSKIDDIIKMLFAPYC